MSELLSADKVQRMRQSVLTSRDSAIARGEPQEARTLTDLAQMLYEHPNYPKAAHNARLRPGCVVRLHNGPTGKVVRGPTDLGSTVVQLFSADSAETTLHMDTILHEPDCLNH